MQNCTNYICWLCMCVGGGGGGQGGCMIAMNAKAYKQFSKTFKSHICYDKHLPRISC